MRYLEEKGTPVASLSSHEVVLVEKKTMRILFVAPAYNALATEPLMFPELAWPIDCHPGPLASPSYGPQNVPVGALMDRYTDQEIRLAELLEWPLERKILLVPLEVLFFRAEHEKWLTEYMDKRGIALGQNFFIQLKSSIEKLPDTPAQAEDALQVIKAVFSQASPFLSGRFGTELDRLFENRRRLVDDALAMAQAVAPSKPVSSPAVKKAKTEKDLDMHKQQGDDSSAGPAAKR